MSIARSCESVYCNHLSASNWELPLPETSFSVHDFLCCIIAFHPLKNFLYTVARLIPVCVSLQIFRELLKAMLTRTQKLIALISDYICLYQVFFWISRPPLIASWVTEGSLEQQWASALGLVNYINIENSTVLLAMGNSWEAWYWHEGVFVFSTF